MARNALASAFGLIHAAGVLGASQGNPASGGESELRSGHDLGRWLDVDSVVDEQAAGLGLAHVARAALAAPSEAAATQLSQLNIFVRAGLHRQAVDTINRLAGAVIVIDPDARVRHACDASWPCPAGQTCIGVDSLNEIAHWLAARDELDLLLRFFEAFPQSTADGLSAARDYLTPAERVEHLTVLAIGAARGGESDLALSLWRRRLGVDWSTSGLEQFAAAVPCAALLSLYDEIVGAVPESAIGARVAVIVGRADDKAGSSESPEPAVDSGSRR